MGLDNMQYSYSLFLMTLGICSILISSLLIFGVWADCPIANYPRKTTSGYIRAEIGPPNKNSNSLQYSYPLVEPLQADLQPRAMVAVNGFGLKRTPQLFGYEIKISFPDSMAKIQFDFKAESSPGSLAVWNYIQFSFLCTQSPRLILGNLELKVIKMTDNLNNMVAETDVAVLSPATTYTRAVTHIFLSGIQYEEQQLQKHITPADQQRIKDTIAKLQNLRQFGWNQELIKMFVKTLKDQQNAGIVLADPKFSTRLSYESGFSFNQLQRIGTISFNVKKTPRMALKYLAYSYLVYLEQEQQNIYNHISGSFSGYNGTTHSYHPLQHEGMTVIGLHGLNIASANPQEELSFQLQTGSTSNDSSFFYLKIATNNETSFNLAYFGIQTKLSSVCLDCPKSPYIFDYFCISRCPDGYTVSVNSNGALFCSECDFDKLLVPDQSRRKCICPQSHYLVVPTQQCQRCPYDCLSCYASQCLTCDTNPPTTLRIYNPRTRRCECPAVSPNGVGLYDDLANQRQVCAACNPRCQTCRGGDVNQCLTCSQAKFRKLVSGYCPCNTNFVEISSPSGQLSCACLPPYTLNKQNMCILSSAKCPQNQLLVRNTCQCIAGYIRNPLTNICMEPCPLFSVFNFNTNKCQCQPGSTFNSQKHICEPCSSKPHQYYDANTRECQCAEGFSYNNNRQCISCPPNSFYDLPQNRCQCIYNYYWHPVTKLCVKCVGSERNESCRNSNTRFDL